MPRPAARAYLLHMQSPHSARPHPARPSAVPGWAIDVVLAAGVPVFAAVDLLSGQASWTAAQTVLIVGCLVVALLLRRTHPTATVGIVGFLFASAPALGFTLENASSTLYAGIVAVWGIAASLSLFSALCGTVILIVTVSFSFSDPLGSLTWDTAVMGTFFVISRLFATRKRALDALARTARELEASREAEARARVDLERARIARELHDVVAHAVSVMVIQSEAAQRVLDDDAPRAHAALDAVVGTGRQALVELRAMLAVLHEESDGAGLVPQPGVADIPALVQRLRDTGLDVALHAGDVGDAGARPGVDLAAYRVVQEALTNVVKHAGPARADVTLREAGGRLEIEVVDDGRAESSPTGTGRGLVGMRERVELYGGTLETGPLRPHGFRVRAVIPWSTAA